MDARYGQAQDDDNPPVRWGKDPDAQVIKEIKTGLEKRGKVTVVLDKHARIEINASEFQRRMRFLVKKIGIPVSIEDTFTEFRCIFKKR